jgi:hypothetical protein
MPHPSASRVAARFQTGALDYHPKKGRVPFYNLKEAVEALFGDGGRWEKNAPRILKDLDFSAKKFYSDNPRFKPQVDNLMEDLGSLRGLLSAAVRRGELDPKEVSSILAQIDALLKSHRPVQESLR